MANCMFCWPDHIQSTNYQSVTLSGGSWLSDLPLSNLQDPALSTVARSSNDANASTKFDVDLVVGRPVRVFTIHKHNISQAGKVRLTGSPNSDMSNPSYESGWLDVWPVFYESGELPWGYPGLWSGILASEETDGYTMQFVLVLPSVTWARYWRVEIDDTSNPDGYVEFARVSLWASWQPEQNMVYGATLGWETDTPSDRSLSGTDYFDRRNPRRVTQFQIKTMTVDTALKKPFEMMRKLGKDGELFFVFDPEDSQDNMFRRSYLATMRELTPLELPFYANVSHAYVIQEKI